MMWLDLFVQMCAEAGARRKTEPQWWEPLIILGVVLPFHAPILLSDFRAWWKKRKS
jgi:hypothetical protein